MVSVDFLALAMKIHFFPKGSSLDSLPGLGVLHLFFFLMQQISSVFNMNETVLGLRAGVSLSFEICR